MKNCYKCNVLINSNSNRCPLCQSIVESKKDENNIFPKITAKKEINNLVIKIILFATIFSSLLCLMINYLVSKKIGWSLFVVAGIVCFWITFIIYLKKKNNIIRLLFAEMIIILIASIIWDKFTGWYFWSITFVLPFLCIAYISALSLLRIFLKNIFQDYIIYIYINCLIGLIPLYFILKNKLTIEWPSIICVIFSVFLILFLAIFNHNQMKNELERRLHI